MSAVRRNRPAGSKGLPFCSYQFDDEEIASSQHQTPARDQNNGMKWALGGALGLILLIAMCSGGDDNPAETNGSTDNSPLTNGVSGETDPEADTATAPPAAEESPPDVTADGFEKIRNGMTVSEVEAILGSGTKVSETDVSGMKGEVYQWDAGLGGGVIVGTFMNGKLMSKTQMGLYPVLQAGDLKALGASWN